MFFVCAGVTAKARHLSIPDMREAVLKDIGEIERKLNTRTVDGDPITVEHTTLIPLISAGFGLGVGWQYDGSIPSGVLSSVMCQPH